MKKKGVIIPNGVVLETHENATAVFLADQGYDIELIPKSNIEGIHTPDLKMCGLKWEMKAPIGEGKSLMKNTIQKAVKQSPNIIIDLRRIKRPQIKCLRELEKEFLNSKSIKRLKIITRSGRHEKMLDYKK